MYYKRSGITLLKAKEMTVKTLYVPFLLRVINEQKARGEHQKQREGLQSA